VLVRRLGRTGLKVSALCLGGNVFGWTADESASFSVLDAYFEAGGNFIDTADVYSRWASGNAGGESERILGKWMAARGNRESVVIATKVGSEMGTRPNDTGLSRRHIMDAVEASLKRLQTDYIDLYQAHRPDPDTPIDETLRAFDDLVREGKVRYLGGSNYSGWQLTKALWRSDRGNLARFESIQPPYSLVNRESYERELEPLCLDQQVGVITYSSLASGFLTGKYQKGGALPSSARAGGVQRQYMNDKGFAVLDAVAAVAAIHNATPAQVALAWILARPGIPAPIASATTVEQLREIVGAVELRLSDEAIKVLDGASDWR
jgi:aryl-alcohol dehydrogenase-like predicted oxidoreductase